MRCKIPSSSPATDEETSIVPVSATVLTVALYKAGVSLGGARSFNCLLRGGLCGSAGSSSMNLKADMVAPVLKV